jgi:AraC-like DNA-binding protein
VFYIPSISLAFLLSLILFTKNGKTKADIILANWLVIIGIHLAFYYASLVVGSYYYPYLLLGYPFPLLHGPMLYFYTSSLTSQHTYLRKHWAWHFIPALLIYLILIPFFLLSHTERLEVFSNRGQGYEWVFVLQRILVIASGIAYTIASLGLLRKHARIVKDGFSQTERINLIWLRYLIYGVAVVWIAVFFGNDVLIFSLVALFVLLLGYFGIKQVGIFTQGKIANLKIPLTHEDRETVHVSESPNEPKAKYLKSTLKVEILQEIHSKLITQMDGQKLFLNAELTITDLANSLAVHPNHLSQVINSIESKTFYDFVNGRRVEEFKKLVALPENQKYTLLALALECGFNSKTAFYRNFKNATGQSPTQYLKQQHIQIQVG